MPLDEFGREIPNQEPIVIRTGRRVISAFDDVRAYIRRELSAQAAGNGAETFDEANDFDVGDDYDPKSPWEYSADQEEDDRAAIAEHLARHEAKRRQQSGAGAEPQGGPEGREPAASAGGISPVAGSGDGAAGAPAAPSRR